MLTYRQKRWKMLTAEVSSAREAVVERGDTPNTQMRVFNAEVALWGLYHEWRQDWIYTYNAAITGLSSRQNPFDAKNTATAHANLQQGSLPEPPE